MDDLPARLAHAHPSPDWLALGIGLAMGIVFGLCIARMLDAWRAIKQHAAARKDREEQHTQ